MKKQGADCTCFFIKLKNKNQKHSSMKLIVSLLLISLLILVACNNSDPQDACSEFEGSKQDDCYLQDLKCSKVENSQTRDSCVAELAKSKGNISVCGLIESSQIQGYCIQQIALQKNDAVLCQDIDEEYWEDNCNLQIALKGNDFNLCPPISNNEQEDECYKEIALDTNNPDLCKFLEPEDTQRCYSIIALDTLNTTICANVESPVQKDVCYLKIAGKAQNKSICKEISFHQIESDCNAQFS